MTPRFLGARLILPARLEEPAVAAFWESGCLGVAVTAAGRRGGDPRVRLTAYFPARSGALGLAGRLARSLEASGLGARRPPRLAPVPDRNWAAVWQRSLRPMAIGRRFLVIPEGCRAAPRPGRVPIQVRFGQAFGTGEHASTRLSLRLLEEILVPGQSVIDLGTGTAILAMAAARLGAGRVVAVDHDETALRVAADNVADNRLGGRVRLRRADAAEVGRLGRFDLALVNIGATVIERVLPDLASALERGGHAVLAGLLIENEDRLVRTAAPLGLTLRRRLRTRPWSALLLRRET